MKRIANDVAVATLLYTVPLDSIVRIVDIDPPDWVSLTNYEELYLKCGVDYTVDAILHNIDNTRIANAKVWRTDVSKTDGTLTIVIDTATETY